MSGVRTLAVIVDLIAIAVHILRYHRQMRLVLAIALLVVISACKQKDPPAVKTSPSRDAGAAAKPAVAAADAAPVVSGTVALASEPLAALAPDQATAKQLEQLAGPAAPACAMAKAAFSVAGYADAKGRRWYGVTCDHGKGKTAAHAYVVVAGFPERPIAGAIPDMYAGTKVDSVVVYALAGAPLLCLNTSWHDEERLREGTDTHCVREVDGKLAVVYSMGDTSLADGTTSSFDVIAGPPEAILDIVDCDDCEVCAIEDDCSKIPAGEQRYARRLTWNGKTFAGPNDRVRTGPTQVVKPR